MSEKKENIGKMNRVSLSLGDRENDMLKKLSDGGYLGCHKPTTLATQIVTKYLWDNYQEIRTQIEAVEADLNG